MEGLREKVGVLGCGLGGNVRRYFGGTKGFKAGCKRKFKFWACGQVEKRFEFKRYWLRWRKQKVDDGHRSSAGNIWIFLSFRRL